jgi:hypothetical protein
MLPGCGLVSAAGCGSVRAAAGSITNSRAGSGWACGPRPDQGNAAAVSTAPTASNVADKAVISSRRRGRPSAAVTVVPTGW